MSFFPPTSNSASHSFIIKSQFAPLPFRMPFEPVIEIFNTWATKGDLPFLVPIASARMIRPLTPETFN